MRMIQTLLFAAAAFVFTPASSIGAPEHGHAHGAQYLTLPAPQNTEAGAKVEVTEFFSYTCPHCRVFEPALVAWVKKNAGKVAFKRVHVGFRPSDQILQRVYATLESLDLVEASHAKVFAAIHEEDQRFNSDEDAFNWAAKAGIDRARFIAAYRSFGAEAKVTRAQAMVAAYRIDQWPMLAVGGRYLTSPHLAGAHSKEPLTEAQQQQAALAVVDTLVDKSKVEKK